MMRVKCQEVKIENRSGGGVEWEEMEQSSERGEKCDKDGE